MHPERVNITRVSAGGVAAVVITVVAAIRAFESLLLGNLLPII
jgi:hypothetical protein